MSDQEPTTAQESAGAPWDVLRPYRTHRLYQAAVSRVHLVKVTQGTVAARTLAQRIATEFEEVTIRETANRIRMAMEEAPESTKAPDHG